MDYMEMYRQKLTTADEAVKVIKSGDWVDYGFCAIHPRVLDEALARRAPELEDVLVPDVLAANVDLTGGGLDEAVDHL